MRTASAALTLLLAIPAAAAAPTSDAIDVDHETWSVLGWNDACGVAYEHLYYPKLGEAISSEPISTRVGTAAIPLGSETFTSKWAFEADGRLSWNEKEVAIAERELKAGGYARPGFLEVIQDAPVGNQPGLAETILSTANLSVRITGGWPGSDWRWAGANYSPLGTCALLAYERRDKPRRYQLLLVRVYNPRARRDRAYAHASNARLLFEAGSLPVAVAEAETAALLDPILPIARYEYAAMLALTGNFNESIEELAAAIKLQPKYRKQSRDDVDFADLKERQDFQDLTK
ncbi:MAG: TPR end-of-group domain-containing protein [Elusimicrobiota bacterium]